MVEYNDLDAVPVPRRRVFALEDGTFVVQWEEHRVQSLMSGKYLPFTVGENAVEPISDYELNQLRNAGIIVSYDQSLVHLAPSTTIVAQKPARAYYLNTTLDKTRLPEVENVLREMGLARQFALRVQAPFLVVRGPAGMAFLSFEEAERARETLVARDPNLFGQSVVAFVEIIADLE